MQKAKGFKIGMQLEKREKIITAWENLGKPNSPHIVYLSNHVLLWWECDLKITHVILICDHPFSISGKEQLDGFQ